MARHRIAPTTPLKLSLADKKIISLLQQNGRMPLSQMAKYVNLSIPAVSYRINRLTEGGVIFGFQAHVAFLPDFKYAFMRIRSRPGSTEKLLQFLENHPQTITLFHMVGDFDVAVGLILRPHSEKKIIDEIRNAVLLESVEWNDATQFSSSNLDYSRLRVPSRPHGVDRFFAESNFSPSEKYSLTRSDIRLLRILTQNCRTPIHSIKIQEGGSELAIKHQMTNLIQRGIIQKFFASINPYAIDSYFFACMWVNAAGEGANRELIRIMNHMQVGNGVILLSSGPWTHALFLHFRSMDELFAFEKEVRSIPSWKTGELQLVSKQFKLEWIPPYVLESFPQSGKVKRAEKVVHA